MSDEDFEHMIDLEAQHTPLLTDGVTPRLFWNRIILFLRSSEIFIAGANIAGSSPALSRVSSLSATYTLASSCDAKDEDLEIVKVDDNLTASPANTLNFDHNGVELQRCQSANITKIVRERRLHSLQDFGGVGGIADALETDLDNGIPGDNEDILRRRMDTHTHCQIQAPALNFIHFLSEASNNYTIFLLLLAAALSFVFGIKQEGRENGWFDGAIICFTIIILIFLTSTQKYCYARWSWKKAKKQKYLKERELDVHVIRGGRNQWISISDLVRGDIVCLERGSQVPADGLFVAGQALELDDGLWSIINERNPFLFYGARVINGNAHMIVTSVGMKTVWSEMMSTATNSPEKKTKLEAHIDKLSTCIHITGLLIAILMLIVVFLRFVCGKIDQENGYRPESKGEPPSIKLILNTIKKIIVEPMGRGRVLTNLLSVSLLGIIEGIPVVVSIAITYWNQKTMLDKATEQEFIACVSMASVTTICTDIIGCWAAHEMEVTDFFIGEEVINESSVVSPYVLEVLCEGIGTFILTPQSASSVEASLLSWAAQKLGMQQETLKQHCTNIEERGGNPDEELCGVLVEKNQAGVKERSSHWKGPAAKILGICSHFYDSKGNKQAMDDQKRKAFGTADKRMRGKNLNMIAFACKGTDSRTLEGNNLTLVGLIGLKKTSRDDTRQAVSTSIASGIKTILVSGQDVSELETIAHECGLLTPDLDAPVLRSEDFRKFTNEEMWEKLDQIRVMGNSLPADKLLLVKRLKEKGEVVAMIGQQTNDCPALKEANIGLAMGTWSSDKARENSEIVIWDGNFSFAVHIIKFGKCLHNNIQKFIQFELIMTISSLSINLIGTLFLGDAPITTIQLFWVNLVVAFVGGLALLTGSPSERLMNIPPVNPTKPFITKAMWRNILIQALYQITTLVTLQHKGNALLGINDKVRNPMIFNCFVICQFFNQFNAWELEEKNIFRGLQHSHWFWVASVLFIGLQAVFILITGAGGLGWKLWMGCFLVGSVSLLIDCAGKWASSFMRSDWFTGWRRECRRVILMISKCFDRISRSDIDPHRRS